MKDLHITVDGIPLEDVLAAEQNNEIALHLKNEAKTLAVQCGVRRSVTLRTWIFPSGTANQGNVHYPSRRN